MDSSVSLKDEIWFLRVCHYISTGLYIGWSGVSATVWTGVVPLHKNLAGLIFYSFNPEKYLLSSPQSSFSKFSILFKCVLRIFSLSFLTQRASTNLVSHPDIKVGNQIQSNLITSNQEQYDQCGNTTE